MHQLQAAKDRYKSYANANRKDVSFQIGDQVLLSTININKHNMRRKFYSKYIGPFKITAIINDVAYELDLDACLAVATETLQDYRTTLHCNLHQPMSHLPNYKSTHEAWTAASH